MSILGAVVRAQPARLAAVREVIGALPGVEIAIDPDDGRLILLIEDAVLPDGGVRGAADTLTQVAALPDVLNTSLVYEYSGADAPALEAGVDDYRAWRGRAGRGRRASTAPAEPAPAELLPNTNTKEPEAWN